MLDHDTTSAKNTNISIITTLTERLEAKTSSSPFIVRYNVSFILLASTIDIVNRGLCGSIYLIVKVSSNSNEPLPALLNTKAEINLLPLFYYN